MTWAQAIEYLGGAPEQTNVPPPKPAAPTWEDMATTDNIGAIIRRANSYKSKSVEYFSQYGLDKLAVERYWLGYLPELDGFTIPHFVTLPDGSRKPKGMKVRRANSIGDQPKYFTYKIDRDKRYYMAGVYLDKWITAPDQSRLGPKLDALYIVEDEKSAMVLDWLGYPAIAYMPRHEWNEHLSTALLNIRQVIIIADNDAAKDNDNAGVKRALKVQQWAGRPCQILMHPTYNDMADLVRADGPEGLHQWLHSTHANVTD